MSFLSLLMKRELRCYFNNSYILISPIIYTGACAILLSFTSIPISFHLLLFITCILSINGWSRHILYNDYKKSLIIEIWQQKNNLYIFILIKGMGCGIGIFLSVLPLLSFAILFNELLFDVRLIFVSINLSITIAFIYTFLDSIYCSTHSNNFLNLIFVIPFIIPAIIFSFMAMSQNSWYYCGPIISYTIFTVLMVIALANELLIDGYKQQF